MFILLLTLSLLSLLLCISIIWTNVNCERLELLVVVGSPHQSMPVRSIINKQRGLQPKLCPGSKFNESMCLFSPTVGTKKHLIF